MQLAVISTITIAWVIELDDERTSEQPPSIIGDGSHTAMTKYSRRCDYPEATWRGVGFMSGLRHRIKKLTGWKNRIGLGSEWPVS